MPSLSQKKKMGGMSEGGMSEEEFDYLWSNKCPCGENSRKFKKIGFLSQFSLFYKVNNFRE